MSIFTTRLHVGDYYADIDMEPGKVGVYGGSHLIHPISTAAAIQTAHAMVGEVEVGPWLRISYASPAVHLEFLIDTDAAEALQRDLARWVTQERKETR